MTNYRVPHTTNVSILQPVIFFIEIAEGIAIGMASQSKGPRHSIGIGMGISIDIDSDASDSGN